jgi:hypothetical protein
LFFIIKPNINNFRESLSQKATNQEQTQVVNNCLLASALISTGSLGCSLNEFNMNLQSSVIKKAMSLKSEEVFFFFFLFFPFFFFFFSSFFFFFFFFYLLTIKKHNKKKKKTN